MQDLRPLLLPDALAHRMPGIPTGAVHPDYEGGSLLNLPASVCHWLDVPRFGAAPLRPAILDEWSHPFRHVILILVDGLGLGQLEQALEEEALYPGPGELKALVDRCLLAPITSITPSTTAAALTTLWTGAPAAAHGVVGYEMWLKEYGMIINGITYSAMAYSGDPGGLRRAGFTPEGFLPVPTLGPHLARHGVQVQAYHHTAIYRSTLSSMLLREVTSRAYRNLSDLFVTLSRDLADLADRPSYSYIYWGELDDMMHRYGPQDQRVGLELAAFTRVLSHFIATRPNPATPDTLLLLCADHGQMPTPGNPHYELRNHPLLLDCLVMNPSGEARMPILFLRSGREETARQYIQDTWPGEFILLPATEVIASGILGIGQTHTHLADRLGDAIALPTGSAYWWWGTQADPLRGRHGGLSAEEMLAPLLALAI